MDSGKILNGEEIQKIISNTVDNKLVFGVQLSVKRGKELWDGSAGNLTGRPFFITSLTKLFDTAIILKWRSEGRLSLDDRISLYLPDDIIHGLHVFKGRIYSDELTIRHLLTQTSGLPDYFEDREVNKMTLQKALTSGIDQSWSFDQVVAMTKTLKAKFPPGTKKKAHYSDTNFQLLGKIIENISGKNFKEVLDETVLKPLRLTRTYLYSDPEDKLPVMIYSGTEPLKIMNAMASFGPDGGIVSTAPELMSFMTAFFNGTFFPKEYLPRLHVWMKIMPSTYYGTGIMRLQPARIVSPFTPPLQFLGHAGISGSFAWYIPEEELYLTGTVNQIRNAALSYRMLLKIIRSLK